MPNQSDNPKLDSYLSQEIASQSPSARLRTSLGLNGFDEDKFNDLYRSAQSSGGSIKTCEWCQLPFVCKNVRADTLLCGPCSPGRQSIELWKARHKVHNLSDADKVSIANDKTTRYGRNKPK